MVAVMAAHLARTLSPQELIEKGICPVKKEYIVDEIITRKEMEAVGSVVAEKPAAKKSNTQKRKESKAKAKEQLCFHHLRGTCTFGDECKFKHDLTDYVRRKPQDLPGSGKLDAEQVSDSMATPGKQSVANGQTATGSQQNEASALDAAAKENMNGAAVKSDNDLGKEVKAEEVVKTEGATGEAKTEEAVKTDVGTVQVKPEAAVKAEGATAQSDAQEDPATVQLQGLQMYVLPVPTEIKPVQNQMTADVGHDLRKHTYDFSRADNVLKALGVSNNLKMRDRKPKKKAADAQVDEKSTRGDLIKSSAAAKEPTPESKTTSAEPEAQQAVKKQKVEGGEGTIPIYDISKSSNTEGGIVNQRDGAHRIDFAGKLYCAPLTTTGNLPFRRIVKQFGCDITCGEMALASNLLQGQQSEWALLKRHPCEDLFGVQICGAHPDSVARCVQLLDDNLALDFIDLNMGCPIDLICNKGMGSALLQRPKRFAQVVQAAAKTAQNCVVTFKTRTGFYDKQRTAAELLKDVGPWGVAAVTVHGRTRAQRYSKLADWDYVEHCAAMASPANVQVIGNGDVFSFEDYEAHMKSGNLASCMIARGALIKPWLFTEIKERRHWDISATERLDMLKEYCKHGLEHWGSDEKGVENTRRFLLEWLSFLCRYVPVGLLEVLPQNMTSRPPTFKGRSDLETLLSSNSAQDWVRITEMLLGPAPEGFVFMPKHKSNSYETVKAGEEEVQG